ncbi:MAG: ABC transporter ATP-binding protein, partial [Candidatus Omnitrophica bacterium]|nr:ABC transporter ATP-binding protein [Candidatus Omnitrophota bacterium]
LGSLMAATLYLGQLSSLQSTFTNFLQQIFLGSVSIERLEAILSTPGESQELLSAKQLVFSAGNIKFNNISFGFIPDRLVLDNLTFDIPGGSCLGLVGPSGCGKTTLVNLLLRIYQPINGTILIDGCDIRQIQAKAFYEQIGLMLQEPWLWNDTIENNIRYGKDNANTKEIEEAARIACIDDFIMGLPEGYNSRIGENASKISEGQKQRLAIARALIKRPKILILDEAFSFVNEGLEAKIIDNIKSALEASTIILIAHRLSVLSKTDRVYFFTGPRNIEIAQHEKLFKDNPSYRNFFTYLEA